jgi:hypothetical protein
VVIPAIVISELDVISDILLICGSMRLCVYPFLLCFIFYRKDTNTFHKWIPIIIFTNGFLYHILFNNYILIRLLDVYTNLGHVFTLITIQTTIYSSNNTYSIHCFLFEYILKYYPYIIQMPLLHLCIKSKPGLIFYTIIY